MVEGVLQTKKKLPGSSGLVVARASVSKGYARAKTIQAKGVIQLKPPTDENILTYTDDLELVWSRDLQTNKWCRLGEDNEKIFWSANDDNRQKAFPEAGSVVEYFKNPKSIWGKTHQNLAAQLLAEGFEESEYRGTSEAHEYKKVLSDKSVISIVINYGGGRHTHTLNKAKFEPAFYYKLEWNKYFSKMKIIDPTTYPREERAQEKFEFIEK